MKTTKMKIDIPTSTLLRIVAVIAAIFLVIEVWEIFASVFLAIVIAAALDPTLSWLEERKIRRIISVPIIYLLSFAITAGVFYAVVPGLFAEIETLSKDLPEKIDTFVEDNLSGGLLGDFSLDLDDALQNLEDNIGELSDNVFVFATTIFGGVVSLVFTIVASFYLALDRDEVRRFLMAVTPSTYHRSVGRLWTRIQKRLGYWMQAQFVIAIFMGVNVFILLTILGSPFALTLGLVAGFLEIIPFLGPLIAGALIFGLLAVDSLATGIIAVAVYILFQQIEQNVVIPTIMSRLVGSNPLVILVAALVGAELLGFWGVVLAVPFVAVLGEVLRDIRRQNKKKAAKKITRKATSKK